MHLSKALELINLHQPEGCFEYWSSQPGDPWQKAHDSLESDLKISGMKPEVAITAFYAEIRRLQDDYRRMGLNYKSSPMTRGLYSNTTQQAAAKQAADDKLCVVCMSKINLQIIKVEGKLTPCCALCVEKLQGSDEQMPLF